MIETFHQLKIESIACALPEKVVELDSFIPQVGETVIKRLKQVVGVERFPVAGEGQRASDLAEAAAKHLMAQGRLDPSQIDVVLFVTQTPDAIAPATSALLQQRLGLPERVFALDINQGCAGFLAGLLTAAHFLAHPNVRKVLLLGGDTLSRLLDPEDYKTALMFGDAGFATVIGRGEGAPWTFLSATASSPAIEIPHGGHFTMDGTAVFNFTISRVPEQLQALLAATGETVDCFDALYLHQANAFIVQQVARMVGFPQEKVPCRMTNRGNTSAASIPLLLCDLSAERAGQPSEGPRPALFSAFGVGLTWISARMEIDLANCLPPITV